MPAQLETGAEEGSGGVGSLLLLLSPVHREVTVLAKASPADPVLGDAGGLSGQGHHPEASETVPFVTHTPTGLG